MMKSTATVKNRFDIAVKKACMSCAHKECTRLAGTRYCKEHQEEVGRYDACRQWRMSDSLKMAGSAQGVVRDIQTKEVVIY